MADKNYISGLIMERTSEHGKFFTMSLKLDDLASCEVNDKGYIKVNVFQSKEPFVKDGKTISTHYAVEDTYKPDGNYTPKTADKPAPKQEEEIEDIISIENIPF